MNIVHAILCFAFVCRFSNCETDENLEIWFQQFKKRFDDFMINITLPAPIQFSNDLDRPLLLSKYIEMNDTDTARRLSLVESDVFENVSSHAGFITVDKVHNSNLWFWYFPAEQDDAEESPLVVWLQGGPGISSLYGLFNELGPFIINEDNSRLSRNPYSWHTKNSLIFIDNPVGTGFSFTNGEDGYARNLTIVGEHFYEFIVQFLQIFPDLQKSPLYITGESFAGKYVPCLAYTVHKKNSNADFKVNLKGIAIGNGFIDPIYIINYSTYFYQLGLIDNKQAESMIYFENKAKNAIEKSDFLNAYYYFHATLTIYSEKSEIDELYNYVQEESYDYDHAYTEFVQRPEIRKALHVGNLEFSNEFKVYRKLIDKFMTSGKLWLEELLEHYKVLLFSYEFLSGQLDVIVPYPLAVKSFRNLQWSKSAEYLNATRKAWYEKNRVIGFTKKAGNLLEVFFRNAGHMIGIDQPRRFRVMINSFFRNIAFQNIPDNE